MIVYTLLLDGLFSHNKPQNPVSGKRKLTGPHRWKDRLWEMNCGILGLLLSQGAAFVITQIFKNMCGRPRPDLIDRCQPSTTHDPTPFGLSSYTICQGDPALIKDGFKSWPSGHSSSSFAGLFYLTLWLCGKLHVMDNRGEVWKTAVVMIPSVAASLIALSRIMDARHHPFDVISGCILGTFTAYVSYRQYFPPITEAWKKGRAYPIRTWASEPMAPSQRHPMAFDESTAALRNPEEERVDVSEESGTRGQMPPPTHQAFPASHSHRSPVYARRDDDGNYSSSSEDVADGFELSGYVRTHEPNSSAQFPGYEVDTGYQGQYVPNQESLNVLPGAMTAHR